LFKEIFSSDELEIKYFNVFFLRIEMGIKGAKCYKDDLLGDHMRIVKVLSNNIKKYSGKRVRDCKLVCHTSQYRLI
jgi:hypothetical protein